MAETNTCCSKSTTKLIAACSGRSNVGQIANQVMVEVDKAGAAKSFCLAGVGAGLSGFVESARSAQVIMVDGCPMACGRKVLEKYEIEPFQYFVVTELGIKKEDTLGDLDAGTRQVLGQVRANI